MERVLVSTGANLFVTFYSDDTAINADGAVTVTVTDGDGVAIATSAATVKPGGTTGKYQYTLLAQTVAKRLTLAWTGTFGGVVSTVTTEAEVVGGRFFSIAEVRAKDPVLAQVKYTSAVLDDVRVEVEDEFERITGRSPFVRWGMTQLWSDAMPATYVDLNHNDVQALLSVTVDGVAFSQPELDNLQLLAYGRVTREDGSSWPTGAVLEFTYTYGMSTVTADLKVAGIKRLRSRVVDPTTGIPDRATSLTSPEGGTFQLATPGRGGFETGVPDVDAVYKRYSFSIPGVG